MKRMLYPKLSIKSPVDQSVLSWIDSVPDKYRENITLMDCVTRFVHRINDLPDFGGINPFYKLTEILSSSEMYYCGLVEKVSFSPKQSD